MVAILDTVANNDLDIVAIWICQPFGYGGH